MGVCAFGAISWRIFFVRSCLSGGPQKLLVNGFLLSHRHVRAEAKGLCLALAVCNVKGRIYLSPLSSGCLVLICRRAGAETNTLLRNTYCLDLELGMQEMPALVGVGDSGQWNDWRRTRCHLLCVCALPCVCVVVFSVCVLVLRSCGPGPWANQWRAQRHTCVWASAQHRTRVEARGMPSPSAGGAACVWVWALVDV
jgi:hypothetical protein